MFLKILVPLDGSETSECVLPYVKLLTSTDNRTTVHFIYVVAPLDVPMIDAKYKRKIETESHKAASNYLKGTIASLDLKERAIARVIAGKPAETITDFAAKHKMDLIVMATHGRSGVSRWMAPL